VLVTGAGSGIGAALALEANRRGASVVICTDIDGEAAERTAETIRSAGGTAVFQALDILDADAVATCAAEVEATHGTPGLVCANAGVIGASKPLLGMDLNDARWVLDVNVMGTLHTLQAFGRILAASESVGWILVTGSEHSLGRSHNGAAAYTASKHAVLGMCDVFRAELPDNVGVSVLCPGVTNSQLWDAARNKSEAFGGPESGHEIAESVMAMGMPPGDVADKALSGAGSGHFIIASHANAAAYAQSRAADVADAFERLADQGETRDYDLDTLVAEFMTTQEADAP